MTISAIETAGDHHDDRALQLRSSMASLGHDLRNAVMPLLLHLDLLDLCATAAPDPRASAQMSQLIDNLQRLANGLLLRTTEPASDTAVEALHLHRWWHEIGALLRAPLPAGCTLSVRLPIHLPPVRVDHAVLAQVLLHVMVSVRLALSPAGPQQVLMAARRTTRGVTLSISDEHSRIAHQRGRNQDAHVQQWGMSLADSLLQRTGGMLSGYSTPERGTRVTLRLAEATMMDSEPGAALRQAGTHASVTVPAVRATPIGYASATAAGPRRALRLLIIDDNAALTGALSLRLAMESDIECLAPLHTLHGALQQISDVEPDLVLLDLNMPGHERPLELIRQLHALGSAARVVIFTGNPSHEAIRATREAGAAGFIAKGLAPDRLLAALHRATDGEDVLELDV